MSNEPKIKKVTLTNEQAEKVTGGSGGGYTDPDIQELCEICYKPFIPTSKFDKICPDCLAKQQNEPADDPDPIPYK